MSERAPRTPLPRVRTDLEFIPITHENQQLILVRDHLGLVADGQALPVYTFQLLQVLNNTRDANALREAMVQITQGGQLISQAEVFAFINELDAAYLLETPHFSQAYQQIIKTFAAETIRPCALCGRAYPLPQDELISWLDTILAKKTLETEADTAPKVLVAPHIDPTVGARVYANAYAQLKNARPKRVLILGVGHQLAEGLFSITDKSFATPLGIAPADTDAVAQIRAAGQNLPGCLAQDDFSHRSEHSIEFQLLFLQHLLPADSFSIIPILCGSPQLHLPEYTRAAFIERCAPVIESLAAIAGDAETLVVAGVDMSHIGPKFGHEKNATELEQETAVHDKNLLQSLVAGAPEAFWQESARIQDAYNVCGFSALATLLEILPGAKGRSLDYNIWHEAPTRSGVSFAAAVFPSPA